MLHTSISIDSKMNNTMTAPIEMSRLKKVASSSDMDDQGLSSTLKESNMLISSSSSSGGSCDGENGQLGQAMNLASGKKKNSRKRRQKRRESQAGKTPEKEKVKIDSSTDPINVGKKLDPRTEQCTSDEVSYFNAYEQNQLDQDEGIFSEYYDNKTPRPQVNHFEFFLDDDDLVNTDSANNINHNTKPKQLPKSTHTTLIKQKNVDEYDEEDSSDYFLASSVDTVVNAPFINAALGTNRGFGVKGVAAKPVNFRTNAATASLSASQNSLNNSVGSYTNSLAKDFLCENKFNVNISNKAKAKEQTESSIAVHGGVNVSNNVQIPVSGTPAGTGKQGKHHHNQKSSKPSAPVKNVKEESTTTKPQVARQASKPMQFINSFVSAVANGAMSMMSSTKPTNSVNGDQATIQSNSSQPANSKQVPHGPIHLASKAEKTDNINNETSTESTQQLKEEKEEETTQPVVASALVVTPVGVEEVLNPLRMLQPVLTTDVNKRNNRKSYSEVILTESTLAKSMNDFNRPRPNSMSLNNQQFNINSRPNNTTPQQGRTNYTTPNNGSNRQTTRNSYNSHFNNSNNYNYNNNNYQNSNSKTNRHSLCVSAPLTTQTSANSFTKPTSFGKQSNNKNRSKPHAATPKYPNTKKK